MKKNLALVFGGFVAVALLVGAAAPIRPFKGVFANEHGTSTVGGIQFVGNVTAAQFVGDGSLLSGIDAGLAQTNVPIIVPLGPFSDAPASASLESYNGGSGSTYYNAGYNHAIRVYAYRTNYAGERYYSTAYAESDTFYDSGESSENYTLTWQWGAVAGTVGYMVLKNDSYNGYAYDHGIETAGTSWEDDGSGLASMLPSPTISTAIGGTNMALAENLLVAGGKLAGEIDFTDAQLKGFQPGTDWWAVITVDDPASMSTNGMPMFSDVEVRCWTNGPIHTSGALVFCYTTSNAALNGTPAYEDFTTNWYPRAFWCQVHASHDITWLAEWKSIKPTYSGSIGSAIAAWDGSSSASYPFRWVVMIRDARPWFHPTNNLSWAYTVYRATTGEGAGFPPKIRARNGTTLLNNTVWNKAVPMWVTQDPRPRRFRAFDNSSADVVEITRQHQQP